MVVSASALSPTARVAKTVSFAVDELHLFDEDGNGLNDSWEAAGGADRGEWSRVEPRRGFGAPAVGESGAWWWRLCVRVRVGGEVLPWGFEITLA